MLTSPLLFRGWDMDTEEMLGASLTPYVWKRSIFNMQFTGLHDTNGKRIFVGDIIKGQYRPGPGIVVFEKGAFMALFVRNKSNDYAPFMLYEFTRYEGDNPTARDFTEQLETRLVNYTVIGNIFENPNLVPEDAQERAMKGK